MRLSSRLERQPELPATTGAFRFLYWVVLALVVGSVLAIGESVIDFPARLDAD
jgi:hypothetical protein